VDSPAGTNVTGHLTSGERQLAVLAFPQDWLSAAAKSLPKAGQLSCRLAGGHLQ